MCDLETSRMGAPYIYDISRLRVNCCAIFVVCTYIFDTCGHGSRVGHPCSGQFVVQGIVLGCECEPESSVRPSVRPYILVRFEDVTHNIKNER